MFCRSTYKEPRGPENKQNFMHEAIEASFHECLFPKRGNLSQGGDADCFTALEAIQQSYTATDQDSRLQRLLRNSVTVICPYLVHKCKRVIIRHQCLLQRRNTVRTDVFKKPISHLFEAGFMHVWKQKPYAREKILRSRRKMEMQQ